MTRLRVLVPAAAVALGLVSVIATLGSVEAGIAVAVVGGVAGSMFLLGPVLANARSIQRAAEALASGNYAARADYRGPAELGSLTDTINAMAHQVQLQMSAASEGRNRLMAALDSSVDPVLALDLDSRVVFANLAAQQLFDRDAGSIVGSPVAWLLPDEQVIEAVRNSRESGTQTRIDIERPGRRFFQVVTSSIAAGGEWAVLVVLHDVSDVRRTDQIRRDFVANVSHELRTPLAGIKAVIETLAEGAIDDREAAMDFLSRADFEVDRLILLVEELLDLSQIESGEVPLKLRPTDIEALVREVMERLRPQAERKRIELNLVLPGTAGTVTVDPERIERAVLNLVQNAVKFTPEGGTVTVTAEGVEGAVTVRVADTGIGIDSASLPRVFERFYKADHSRTGGAGSGIGLAIVKHAVEAHGGSVSVDSSLGAGATFTITLPAKSPAGQPS